MHFSAVFAVHVTLGKDVLHLLITSFDAPFAVRARKDRTAN